MSGEVTYGKRRRSRWTATQDPLRTYLLALPFSSRCRCRLDFLAPALALGLSAGPLSAQQPTLAQQAIAYVPTEGVSLSGPLRVADGRAAVGNNSTITAADKSAQVTLARGGTLRICSSTSVHISRDALPLASAKPSDRADGQDDAGLMLALDRGALEASYTAGKYSDVLLTPDLRILISGPGMAQVKLRVNQKGDTCIDNSGSNAPYVTVSSLMDGGIYRVQPNQRVLFEHGSLQQVVDREAEPCGCPDPQPNTQPGTQSADSRLLADKHVGGPSSTPADTAFPIAVSEGLAPPPAPFSTPVVPAGQAHAQVTASLSNDTPPGPPPAGAADRAPAPGPAGPRPSGFFHKLGHLFSRLFGQQ